MPGHRSTGAGEVGAGLGTLLLRNFWMFRSMELEFMTYSGTLVMTLTRPFSWLLRRFEVNAWDGRPMGVLQQRFSLTIPLGSLPFGQEVTSVTSTADALVVDTVGYGIVVGSAALEAAEDGPPALELFVASLRAALDGALTVRLYAPGGRTFTRWCTRILPSPRASRSIPPTTSSTTSRTSSPSPDAPAARAASARPPSTSRTSPAGGSTRSGSFTSTPGTPPLAFFSSNWRAEG